MSVRRIDPAWPITAAHPTNKPKPVDVPNQAKNIGSKSILINQTNLPSLSSTNVSSTLPLPVAVVPPPQQIKPNLTLKTSQEVCQVEYNASPFVLFLTKFVTRNLNLLEINYFTLR